MIGGPNELTRRAFLQSALAVGAVAVVLPEWLDHDAALAGPALAAPDRILVVIELNGGLDGLNALVPYTDASYYAHRRSLAVPAGDVVPIASGLGLNPRLKFLKERYDRGDVAIVRGVGHTDGDRSHFSSMARIMSGSSSSAPATTGWLGRCLDGMSLDGFGAVAIGTNDMPLLLRANRAESTLLPLAGGGLLGADRSSLHDSVTIDAIASYAEVSSDLGLTANRWARSTANAINAAGTVNPAYQPAVAGDRTIVNSLEIAARTLNLDIGTRVIHVRQSGHDTHSGQAGVDSALLRDLDDAVAQFFDTLLPQFHSRTALMTMTEFGRRVQANDALGTDHGTASVWFLIGSRVKGGLYGVQPSLNDLDPRGDLRVHVDHRSVAASVLAGWLQADDRQILETGYPKLDLFDSDAGCAPASASRLALESRFVSITPVRICDTRTGVGLRRSPLGSNETFDLRVLGAGPIPASGVMAVVLNMTATDTSTTSYLTVWPSGLARPRVSNLNFVAGQTVPNLVVAQPGANGSITVFNERGSVNVIADVVGWFPEASPYRPVMPERALDTRIGLGAPAQPLGPAKSLRLALAGRAGVPLEGAEAVVLNVTATDAQRGTWLTVWPSDRSQPYTSNLNVTPGRPVPNLVMAKLSADGAVSIYNDTGTVHVLADVFGWFPAESGFHALNPYRILDTRVGTGAKGKLRPNQVLDIDATCRGDVPPNATAIVANVTVTDPARGGYLTVWPSGSPRPGTSNLNFATGSTVPNLVVSRVGVGGMLSLLSPSGDLHVIADVMGWFE